MKPMKQLTNEQWELYETKYGRLMHTISMKISGDSALATHEDNYSDLCVAALESITGFEKKTGKSFDEAIDTKLFDQYTKTVLWNRKAKKGIPLSKRMDFRSRHVSMDSITGDSEDGSLWNLIPDNKSTVSVSAIDFGEFLKDQPADVQNVISEILKNPGVISNQGFVRKGELARIMGVTSCKLSKTITKIERIMSNYSDTKEMENG